MAIHDGHRARKKEQFRRHGLDAFADHEVLELLLFYAQPRADMNPAAHRLLERFGSLGGVLSASCEELTQVEGVGESAATLLSLMLPLARRVRTAPKGREEIMNSTERAGAYFTELFYGVKQERFFEVCLDAKGKVLDCCQVAEGGADAVNINMRRVVENALRTNASAVVLAHNHPSGIALPSQEDNATTLAAYGALRAVGVTLVDHVIVADDDFVSLRENGLLPK